MTDKQEISQLAILANDMRQKQRKLKEHGSSAMRHAVMLAERKFDTALAIYFATHSLTAPPQRTYQLSFSELAR